MSRVVNRAPLALTSEGSILLNVANLDVPKKVEDIVEAALRERGAVFVGIVLRPDEVRLVLDRLHDASWDAAGWLAAGRQRKKMTKKK